MLTWWPKSPCLHATIQCRPLVAAMVAAEAEVKMEVCLVGMGGKVAMAEETMALVELMADAPSRTPQ